MFTYDSYDLINSSCMSVQYASSIMGVYVLYIMT